jgi:hypothetical protein
MMEQGPALAAPPNATSAAPDQTTRRHIQGEVEMGGLDHATVEDSSTLQERDGQQSGHITATQPTSLEGPEAQAKKRKLTELIDCIEEVTTDPLATKELKQQLSDVYTTKPAAALRDSAKFQTLIASLIDRRAKSRAMEEKEMTDIDRQLADLTTKRQQLGQQHVKATSVYEKSLGLLQKAQAAAQQVPLQGARVEPAVEPLAARTAEPPTIHANVEMLGQEFRAWAAQQGAPSHLLDFSSSLILMYERGLTQNSQPTQGPDPTFREIQTDQIFHFGSLGWGADQENGENAIGY